MKHILRRPISFEDVLTILVSISICYVMRKKGEREFDIRECKKITRREAFDLNEIGLRFKHRYLWNKHIFLDDSALLGWNQISCISHSEINESIACFYSLFLSEIQIQSK